MIGYSYCMDRDIVFIAHDIRSAHNVGSLLRTADGIGIKEVILSGYTPYPIHSNDSRLAHLAHKIDHQIAKTALGAVNSQKWHQADDIIDVIRELHEQNYTVMALEQTKKSIPLNTFTPPRKIAILLGSEVTGIEEGLLNYCDGALEIPMFGKKESFNVVQAAGMAMYHCRFWPFINLES